MVSCSLICSFNTSLAARWVQDPVNGLSHLPAGDFFIEGTEDVEEEWEEYSQKAANYLSLTLLKAAGDLSKTPLE